LFLQIKLPSERLISSHDSRFLLSDINHPLRLFQLLINHRLIN
jgi:hypothetical protein